MNAQTVADMLMGNDVVAILSHAHKPQTHTRTSLVRLELAADPSGCDQLYSQCKETCVFFFPTNQPNPTHPHPAPPTL